MTVPRLSFAHGVFVLSLALFVAPDAIGAEWEVLSRRIRAQIETTDRDLSVLKADIQKAYSHLEESARESRAAAEKWEQKANRSSEARMRAVLFHHRDLQLSFAGKLAELEQVVVAVDRLSERLESGHKLLKVLQAVLEETSEKSNGTKLKPAQLRKIQESFQFLQKDRVISDKALRDLRQILDERASILTAQDREDRTLIAELGSPKDRVEELGKGLVEMELSENAIQSTYLAILNDDVASMSEVLLKTGEMLDIQGHILNSLQ